MGLRCGENKYQWPMLSDGLLHLHCRYSISFGNPVPKVFDISADTGQLRVITELDRERPNGAQYNLRVKARDGGIPSRSSIVNVKVVIGDVNDNAPSFRYPSYT